MLGSLVKLTDCARLVPVIAIDHLKEKKYKNNALELEFISSLIFILQFAQQSPLSCTHPAHKIGPDT